MQAGEIVPQYLHHESPTQGRPSDEFSPPPNAESVSRKRTFSTVSGEFGSPYQAQRPLGSWASQEAPRHLPHPTPAFPSSQATPSATHVFRGPNYSPNGLQPLPQWRNAPEPLRRQSSSFESMAPDSSQADHPSEWDDALIDEYDSSE